VKLQFHTCGRFRLGVNLDGIPGLVPGLSQGSRATKKGSRATKALDPWDRPGTRPNASNLF
jgi:hypothetical protein